MFKSVLLPEPEGPMTATDSPEAMLKLIPFNTSTDSLPPDESNRLLTFCNSSKTGFIAMSGVILRISFASSSTAVTRTWSLPFRGFAICGASAERVRFVKFCAFQHGESYFGSRGLFK